MTTDPLEITLSTLTPIWTGGADGKSDRLHVTGIMGSLRWWYEVMVRGIGGHACDPTSPDKPRCSYDSTKPETFKDVCEVCRVFGATGWARRFQLVVSDEKKLQPVSSWRPTIKASRPDYIALDGTTKSPKGWFFKYPPRSGETTLNVITRDKQFQAEIITGLIQFIADWASIGAKPQMGFGLIDLTSRQNPQYILHHLQATVGARPYVDVPSLQNVFFASIDAAKFPHRRFPDNETFNLKYDLRRLFASNDNLRHFVMGEAPQEGDRQGAKIMISRPYKNNTTIRIWGWIPEDVFSSFGVTRDQVIRQIHTHLNTKQYTINYWREFDSPRDKYRYNDSFKFFESLIRGEK